MKLDTSIGRPLTVKKTASETVPNPEPDSVIGMPGSIAVGEILVSTGAAWASVDVVTNRTQVSRKSRNNAIDLRFEERIKKTPIVLSWPDASIETISLSASLRPADHNYPNNCASI